MRNLLQRNFRIIGVLCCFMFSVALSGCGSKNVSSTPVVAPVQQQAVSSNSYLYIANNRGKDECRKT